jgi:hypothetical protein
VSELTKLKSQVIPTVQAISILSKQKGIQNITPIRFPLPSEILVNAYLLSPHRKADKINYLKAKGSKSSASYSKSILCCCLLFLSDQECIQNNRILNENIIFN